MAKGLLTDTSMPAASPNTGPFLLVMSNRERYLHTRPADALRTVESWQRAADAPAVLRRAESASYVRR